MTQLENELRKRKVADAAGIIDEYGQHFAFKMAAASVSSAALAVCLIGGINVAGVIPQLPYWRGAILGLSFAPLSVLIAVGCVYYWAFVRQLVRSFGRFRHNALASAMGDAMLSRLGIDPQFSAKTKRRLRPVTLVSLALSAACFVLGFIACAMSAGGVQFWHIWGWFEGSPTVAAA